MSVDEAVLVWFKAHEALDQASVAYDERLKLVKAEWARGNWEPNVDGAYELLKDAQRGAHQADEVLYAYMKARSTPLAREHVMFTMPRRLVEDDEDDDTFV